MEYYIQSIWHFINQWYWIPLIILYVGVLGTILIENRNPTKTIAWILVIVFIPFIGLLLYYLFGQKFKKVRRLQKINHEQTLRLEAEFQRLDPAMRESLYTIRDRIGGLSSVFSYLKNERISLPSIHNDVELLINGEEKFSAFIKSLREAKHSIHLEYYIYDLDSVGAPIMEILEEKAKKGIKVRLIVDSFGSPQIVRYMRKHKDTQIEFQVFLPVTFTSLANSNYRNHRKIAIIDGEIGYIGGINLSDRYTNPNAYNLYWRDTSVRIEGDAVAMLQITFWTSWNQTDGKPFILDNHYLKRNDRVVGHAGVSFSTSDPGSPAPYNMEALLMGLKEAQEKIQLCTPYYIPSEELATCLKMAASVGLEVELMIPAEGDSWIVQHATFSFLKPLLERGVKVFLYKKGFLHAKTANVDGKLCYIGTVNLDTRSFYINYEIQAVIADHSTCTRLQEQFELDKQYCELLTIDIWKKRSRWKRGVDSLCRLLAPLL